jgi:hypothetical protein
LPFRTTKYARQINALSLRWHRAEPDRGDVIEAAAGERIVAFARPGKPPVIAAFRAIGRVPGKASIPEFVRISMLSKARRIKAVS